MKDDSLDKIIEKFVKYNKTSTMLLVGVPGIGKSSITAWISDKYKDNNSVIVLRFRDWNGEELEEGLLNAISDKLGCKKVELENKILVIDGFDEIKALDMREELLYIFFNDIKDFYNFKCIITSRVGYISFNYFQNVIELNEFDLGRVEDFCKIIIGNSLDKKEKIKSNLKVLGIPVILYMAIMSNVDISENATKPEIYNRIFAKEGGIFDKFSCAGTEYDIGKQILRDPENINVYLNFLREIAFNMFEKGKLNLLEGEYQIPKLKINNKIVNILEFPIGKLFDKTVINIEFIHKSIYEYFVSEYIFKSLEGWRDISKEKFAGILGRTLKKRRLTKEIIDFLRYRVKTDKSYELYYLLTETFALMLQDGMTYYTKEYYKNVIECEKNVFANMLEILHLWEYDSLKFDNSVRSYLLLDIENLNLMNVDLREVDIANINLKRADMRGTKLKQDSFKGVLLEESIWLSDDIKRMLPQIREARFVYIIIEKGDVREKILRSELVFNQVNL